MLENIKGFAADIDMTLTAKGQDLPEPTKQAFEIMHKNGIPLGLATGRVFEDKLKDQGKNWGLSFEFDFLVCLNGGQVYDARTGRLEQSELLSTDEMKKILTTLYDLVEKYEISVNVEGGGNLNAMNIHNELMDAMRRHGWVFIDKTGDIDGFCEKPAFKFLFRTTAEYGDILRQRFNETLTEDYQIVSTFPGTLEIMRKGIDKGQGVNTYASWYGMTIKDFICFGDNENDNPMLEQAGWGVCLANGSDKSKSISDDVTEQDCFAGGVGMYLMEHYLKPNGMME